MKIIFIGPSGVGKTSIAQKIGFICAYDVFDMDLEVSKIYFEVKTDVNKRRLLELKLLKKISSEHKNCIVASSAGLLDNLLNCNIDIFLSVLKGFDEKIFLFPSIEIKKTIEIFKINLGVDLSDDMLFKKNFTKMIDLYLKFSTINHFYEYDNVENTAQKIVNILKII